MTTENECIEWAGGECPVDPDVMIEIHLRMGDVVGPGAAHDWDWAHEAGSPDFDIIAYRVVSQ